MKRTLLTLFTISAAVLLSCCKKNDDDPVVETHTLYTESTINHGVGDDEAVVTVKDRGEGTGTITWVKGKTYILDGFVFVNDGQTLTIEAGCIIKGKGGSAENASALIVARGGTINASGTAADPIIFTTETETTHRQAADTSVLVSDNSLPLDLAASKGLWGGLIILGKAHVTAGTAERSIEGIPTTETRGLYGGSNDADNSGILKYVIIRHGGTNIGAQNEINGLTLGGVGSGTEIDYVEVVANADDGVEFFGGSVNTKHIVVAFCDDDSYDYDEGYNGKGQYWVTIQSDASDRAGEHDGGASDNETGTPYATPVIYNATYYGNGSNRLLTLRDNAGGTYQNSVFYSYGKGIDIEIKSSGDASYTRYTAGDLKVENSVFFNVASNVQNDIFQISADGKTAPSNSPTAQFLADSTSADSTLDANFASTSNVISVSLPAAGYTLSTSNVAACSTCLDPRAANDAASAGIVPVDSWFETTSYKGAFDATTNWAKTWSTLGTRGLYQ